jgi:hypothetical protein
MVYRLHTHLYDELFGVSRSMSPHEVKVVLQMEDSALFPKDAGSTFPSNFMDIIKRIFKRLFRVYAHIYHTHFVEMCNMKAEAHLNTCFKHFIFFAKVSNSYASMSVRYVQALQAQPQQRRSSSDACACMCAP